MPARFTNTSLVTKLAGIVARFVILVTKRAMVTKRAATDVRAFQVMDCVTESALRSVFAAVRITSVLSLFNCSWLFIILAFTQKMQDWAAWMISERWKPSPDLYSWYKKQQLWCEREGLIGYNLRNRMTVKDKANRTKPWPLGDTEV